MSKSKGKKFVTVFVLLLISVIIVISLYLYKNINDTLLFDSGIEDGETLSYLDTNEDKMSAFNVLLIGTDASGQMTDALMLVNVDKAEKKIRMLSIPRDTKVTAEGKICKINSCYLRGGLDLLFEEIKQLTNAPIHYYALIEPGTLAGMVDSLGGVEYEVERDMYYSDPSQNLFIDLKSGKQVLSGDQAEQYCRFRSYVMGDITRTQCQQKFLKALFEQKLNFSYVTKVYDLYKAIRGSIKTNISFKDIADNLSIMQMLKHESQIECIDTPGNYNDMQKEGVSYYLIRDKSLEELRLLCVEKFMGTYNAENQN